MALPLGDTRASVQTELLFPFAGIYKGFCLDVIRNKYECELQGAKQHLEVSQHGPPGKAGETEV